MFTYSIHRMHRLITLTLQYYRSILLYNIAFTVLTIVLVFFAAGANTAALIYCKVIALAGAIGLHYFSSANTFFYYRNAGVSIRRLYIYALLLDVTAFLILVIPFDLVIHAATHFKR